MRRRALGLTLATVPFAAGALTPLPECMGMQGPEAAFFEYSVVSAVNGFVLYELIDRDGGNRRAVLDNCRTGERLTMTPGSKTDASGNSDENKMWDAVTDAMESQAPYTPKQIARLARRAGATTDVGPAEYESCACKLRG
jgi:hypothetical protein